MAESTLVRLKPQTLEKLNQARRMLLAAKKQGADVRTTKSVHGEYVSADAALSMALDCLVNELTAGRV